jgi:hypothetical protein
MTLLIAHGPSPGLDAAIAEMAANGDEAGIAWAKEKLGRSVTHTAVPGTAGDGTVEPCRPTTPTPG